jgi:hypothetical protein
VNPINNTPFDPETMKDIRRRVGRRVRGKLIYLAHRGVFIAMTALIAIGWVVDPNKGWNTGPIFALWLVLFAFPFALHHALRWLNRKADVLREQEMAQEIEREKQRYQARAGEFATPTSAEKAKRVARLSDDGEIEYADEAAALHASEANN